MAAAIMRDAHGGQETTCITMMIPLIHLGMLIVGQRSV
jgi:multimeric flavodoxin WrbA